MPSSFASYSWFAASCIVVAGLILACDEQGGGVRAEDLLPVDAEADAPGDTDVGARDVVGPPDVASVDAPPVDSRADTDDVDAPVVGDLTQDGEDPDCATAMVDAPCANEGVFCGGCGPTSCSFCNVLRCDGGTWGRIEAFPNPQCHTDLCSPLDAASRCASGEGCYWNETLGVFECGASGQTPEEAICAGQGDCGPGYLCLQRTGFDSTRGRCYQACDPETQDGICGGPCDAMADHGYTNGFGTPIEDIGFCYFLGG